MPARKKIKPFEFPSGELPPSGISPTGNPTRVRHLVAYHNPKRMGYEFWQCEGFSVLTNKRFTDLTEDIVWVVGRPSGRKSFYLDCRFRVTNMTELAKGAPFRYRVSGDQGFVFFPQQPLNKKPWFQQLLAINPNLSLGLQFIQDKAIIAGLKQEHDIAKAVQEG